MQIEKEFDSDYDPDQDSNKEFDIDLGKTPQTKKHALGEFTSASSQKAVEAPAPTTTLSTYNANLPSHCSPLPITISQPLPLNFTNYLKRGKSSALAVIQRIRSLIQKPQVDTLAGRCSNQIVVCRIIQSEKQKDSDYVVEVEDETGTAVMDIGDELVWVGMILVARVEWESGAYRLREKLVRGWEETKPRLLELRNYTPATRIVVAKGPFSAPTQLDYFALNQLTVSLKEIYPEVLILMGPFVTKHNLTLTSQYTGDKILSGLFSQLQQQLPQTRIIIVPSPHDVCSRYPLPQPRLSLNCPGIVFVSNPCQLTVTPSAPNHPFTLSIINTDIISAIQRNLKKKVVRPKQLHRQMCEAYLKQEMAVTACNDILDENNLMEMYNGGRHGDLIIYASDQKLPMVERVGKSLFVGVAGLNKWKDKVGYYAEITVFAGEAFSLMDRVRVDNRKVGY